jgi:hypothetical protein
MEASYDFASHTLTIKILLQPPKRSKRGRALLVASTKGFRDTGVTYHGKPLSISLNAIIPK